MMKHRMMFCAVASALMVVITGHAASAHVHSSPDKVVSGASATVSFVIGHGCAGSPTTKVAIKVPSTVTKVNGVAPKGWKATVNGAVVTFSGSTLADKTKGLFGVSFVAPSKTGVLEFPTVQTCVKGETSWIQPTPASGKEPDYPIPTVTVIAKK
jgi:periplasmic copper chaperone A